MDIQIFTKTGQSEIFDFSQLKLSDLNTLLRYAGNLEIKVIKQKKPF